MCSPITLASSYGVTVEDLRLEAVTTCVGYDDMLDATLALNHPHLDTMIVVTSHDDKPTQSCAKKHGAMCVQSDLFKKNGRNFNKGAAINVGMAYFQYLGWRMHIDADIALPDNFRRVLFNHTFLDKNTIYGCDRVEVVGTDELAAAYTQPQHQYRALVRPVSVSPIGGRFVSSLHGYLPLGFFQLWNAKCQKGYPYSEGTAAHDDTLFSALWPLSHRQHLATIIVHHLVSRPSKWGENWDGQRRQPRLKGK